MHVLMRSTTSARPRAAFPGAPVSEAGIASPTTTTLCKDSAGAAQGRATIDAAIHSFVENIADLAKGIHRDRLEPGLRVLGFAPTNLARRIDRAFGTAVAPGETAVLPVVESLQ